MNRKLMALLSVAILVILAVAPTGAAPLPAPQAGPCVPGAVYSSDCDVNQDSVINVLDVQLAAGHWTQTGVWTDTSAWALTGNAGTTPGVNFLGTTDNQALQVKVNNSRALLIMPNAGFTHNIVGGYSGNAVTAGAVSAVIGGGGALNVVNLVTDGYSTVAGGVNNRAGDNDANPNNAGYATVGGGISNVAAAQSATVGGGEFNQATGYRSAIGGGSTNTASNAQSTVSGGYQNTASGINSAVGGGTLNVAGAEAATIGGGSSNTANGDAATIAGGVSNMASGLRSTVGGGAQNVASGQYATVPGGNLNSAVGNYSFAAGQRAKANHAGSFVWADITAADFATSAANTFRVRAAGGSDFIAGNSAYSLYSTNTGNGDGMRTYAATSQGNNWAALYASNSGSSPGVYANTGTGTYAGYFADQIFVTGGCTGCTLMYVAVNAGGAALEAGDIVAAAGVDSALAGTTDPVLRVRRADADASSVVGVVYRRLTVTPGEKDGELLDSVQAADGAAQPGEHLLIVVQGLAQVKTAGGVAAGQRLTAAGAGAARATRDVEPRGLNTPVLGMALDAPDPASGLAPVMVALR